MLRMPPPLTLKRKGRLNALFLNYISIISSFIVRIKNTGDKKQKEKILNLESASKVTIVAVEIKSTARFKLKSALKSV